MLLADQIEPTTNELVNGLLTYFHHIEKDEPYLYDKLVQNITLTQQYHTTTESSTLVTETLQSNQSATFEQEQETTLDNRPNTTSRPTTVPAASATNMTDQMPGENHLTQTVSHINRSCKTTSPSAKLFSSIVLVFLIYYLSGYMSIL